ncbi:MAG: Mov34/MPN/PAD-1 family protein [Pirellulales bacterium]
MTRRKKKRRRSIQNGFVRPGTSRLYDHDRPVGGQPLPFLKMTQGVHQKILAQLGSRPPEAAGVLLGPSYDEPLATHFVLDAEGQATSVSFTLAAGFLNPLLQQYRQYDLACVGLAHSHPSGFDHPSHGDLEYLQILFRRPANHAAGIFLFPIFSGGKLHPFIVRPTADLPEVTPAALVLV